MLTWRQMLEVAHAARTEVVLSVDGAQRALEDDDEHMDEDRRTRNFGGPSKDAIEKFAQYGEFGPNKSTGIG